MNVYDFDKTIYKGDSTLDFYFWCVKRNPFIILVLPIQFLGFLLYKLKLKDKDYFKQKFYFFLKYINYSESIIDEFWREKIYKITDWYLSQKEDTDIIISASPEFLLKPLEKKLDINKVIASKVDPMTGKLLSKNCYGEEKVIRFLEIYKNKKIHKFYSDSLSDIPLAKLAKVSFLVNQKKNSIKKIN